MRQRKQLEHFGRGWMESRSSVTNVGPEELNEPNVSGPERDTESTTLDKVKAGHQRVSGGNTI